MNKIKRLFKNKIFISTISFIALIILLYLAISSMNIGGNIDVHISIS